MSRGNVKAETERKITAAQDQALRTKYHTIKILQMKETENADKANNFTGQ